MLFGADVTFSSQSTYLPDVLLDQGLLQDKAYHMRY